MILQSRVLDTNGVSIRFLLAVAPYLMGIFRRIIHGGDSGRWTNFLRTFLCHDIHVNPLLITNSDYFPSTQWQISISEVPFLSAAAIEYPLSTQKSEIPEYRSSIKTSAPRGVSKISFKNKYEQIFLNLLKLAINPPWAIFTGLMRIAPPRSPPLFVLLKPEVLAQEMGKS